MRVASLPIINAPPAPVANPGNLVFRFDKKKRFFFKLQGNKKCVGIFVLSGVDLVSTPRRDLAPPIEEDEEPESESQGEGAPLRQIENNISALLRGDIPIARVTGMRILQPIVL